MRTGNCLCDYRSSEIKRFLLIKLFSSSINGSLLCSTQNISVVHCDWWIWATTKTRFSSILLNTMLLVILTFFLRRKQYKKKKNCRNRCFGGIQFSWVVQTDDFVDFSWYYSFHVAENVVLDDWWTWNVILFWVDE